jgi:hypothetical protein
MIQNAFDLAAMAVALSRSTDYRVLRRLVPRPTSTPASGQETKIGILLDTETTGLDHSTHEIIELGMVKFDYTPDGRIVGVRDTFSAFNEPSAPIPPEVTTLTGITDEMVAGHRFDDMAIEAFVEDAVIVIAHNSGFDRRFSCSVMNSMTFAVGFGNSTMRSSSRARLLATAFSARAKRRRRFGRLAVPSVLLLPSRPCQNTQGRARAECGPFPRWVL